MNTKYTFLAPVVLVLALMMAPVTAQACTENVSRGSSGAAVECVQQMLAISGHAFAGDPTGFFGTATEVAVQAFQRETGIVTAGTPESTGYGAAGPQTRRALLIEALQTLLLLQRTALVNDGSSSNNAQDIQNRESNEETEPSSPSSPIAIVPPEEIPEPVIPEELSIRLLPETDELVWQTTDCRLPDGAIQMWKNSEGRAMAPIANPINFALESDVLGGDFEIASNKEPRLTFTSPQSKIEPHQESRLWMMGFWTDDGNDVTALAHQEWYPEEVYATHVLKNTPPCREGENANLANRGWKSNVHHLTSSNGGQTFDFTIPRDPTVVANAYRVALNVEPYGNKPSPLEGGFVNYGYFHPSNIVKEGDYYYFIVGVRERIEEDGDDQVTEREGFMLWRTKDITEPRDGTMYQFWDGSRWTNDTTVLRVGRPYIFTHKVGLPHSEKLDSNINQSYFTMYALKWNPVHEQWIIFGYIPRELSYFTLDSLADPELSKRKAVIDSEFEGPYGNGNTWFATYPTLIDPDSPGYVFQEVDGEAYLYYVRGINSGRGKEIRRMQVVVE